MEETASDTTTTNGKVVGEERVERDNSLVRGSEVAGVPEIVEEILGLVPIPHLYSSCRLVCQKWNNIILREKVQYCFLSPGPLSLYTCLCVALNLEHEA